jgi:DNA-binding response OmpR family regulator
LDDLLLRIKKLLRRSAKEATLVVATQFGQYTFLPNRQDLWIREELHTKLSHRKNELFILLLLKKNQILDRSVALIRVWG